ncbi:uncharacterized protein LOC135935762 isoform X1 [Cloeon dipterum]|uniref:uncharacterized protein LOC135935762 isoform X1 n=1 Tax=Cloeon dipterum TaxID=197152 RepID=UPI00321FBFC5
MFVSKPLIKLIATGLTLGMCKPLGDDYFDNSESYEDLSASDDTSQYRPSRQWPARPASASQPDNIFFPRPVDSSNNPLTSQPFNVGNNPDFSDIFGNGGNGNPGFPPQNRPTPPPQTGGGSSGCSCVSTEEYNPVCGSDNVTYSNPSKLTCALRCGQQTSHAYYGTCRQVVSSRG